MAALELRHVDAGYGRAQVLFGVDLVLGRGEVVVLLGRNGAGKSTTLKSIMGLVQRSSGVVLFEGKSLAGLEPFEIARLGLGYVPEDRRIFSDLTVIENLEVGRKAGGGAVAWGFDRVFALFPALGKRRGNLGSQLSGGEQQMLAVARTLMGNPSTLLLDEPSEGLAPKVIEEMGRAVLALKAAGLSILLSEQNFAFAERVGDRACLLAQGRIIDSGAVRQMRDNPL